MNLWVLLGLLPRIWVRSYTWEQKWLKDSWITKAPPRMVTAHTLGTRVHCAAFKAARQESRDLSRCLSWSRPLPAARPVSWSPLPPSSCSGVRVLFAAQLPSFWEGLWLLLLTLAGRGRVNLAGFEDFLKLFRVVYLPAQGASLQNGKFQSPGNC